MQLQSQSRKRRIAPYLQLIAALALMLLQAPANAIAIEDIELLQAQKVYSKATRIGEREAEVSVRLAYADDQWLGYLFLTNEIAPVPAYSGKPIAVLIGLSSAALIDGAEVLEHEEPILVIGVTNDDLAAYTNQYQEQSALSKIRVGAHSREGYIGIDGISGATITAMVMNRSIMRSAQRISNYYRLPIPLNTDPVISKLVTRDIVPSPTSEVLPEQQAEVATSPLSAVKSMPKAIPHFTMQANQINQQEQWFDLEQIWEEKGIRLSILFVMLAVLIFILFFQDWLVVKTQLFRRIRLVYLLFTVFFIGYYCMAQLSIVNILAFIQLLANEFTWETLMIDPLIFVLWGFVAISIVLWGRGVYCGWLCPFGAMQELIYKLAKKIGLKSYEFPQMVHERLWAIKYIVLILLVGVSLESLATASLIAEIEPFKTSLSLMFQREWWFVVYAVTLLLISAFNSKFFCKYLCSLGAGLSFATRFRVFDWLRRRKECGRPCQTCAAICQISAIKHTGEIIDTECHYCLECQVDYWDDHLCPPLIEKRKKRTRRSKHSQQIITNNID